MVSEKDFADKARKLLELYGKLSKVKGAGQVNGEVYLKYRASLGGRLSAIRAEHLELIKDKMVKVEAGLINISSMSSSMMSQATFTSMAYGLEYQKSTLEAERSKVSSYNEDEYMALLRTKLEHGF